MAKILIVDDERSYRRYISARLARDGHTVETAATQAGAIDLGLTFEPDLLIVDWMLDGGASGGQVADALAQHRPALQTICITGFSAERVLEESRGSSVVRCIEKPFDLDDLADAVRTTLAKGEGGG